MSNVPIFFSQGARWVRADFHLHTKADREFGYDGDDRDFVKEYVAALVSADIRVGVVANHNKFRYHEFKALRKRARKEDILLLPGVELSVQDGANGIHTIVVFNGDEWLANDTEYINSFLGVVFEGTTSTQYESSNKRTSTNLLETIRKLEGNEKDFFLVFAHVEAPNGLWHELKGGRLEALGENDLFRRRTLGFQKVRTHDRGKCCRVQVQQWLGDAYPAEVEGSDPKAVDQIGRGEKSWLKIGDYSFNAVKYALLDHKHRLARELPQHDHSHIQSVSFEGGLLDGQTIQLSPELNTLIGIRGSGKSAIVETIRYALDIPIGERSVDGTYKSDLVRYVLGSGGIVTVHARNREGKQYEVRRINGESPEVYIDGSIQPGVSISDTVLFRPVYFGQQDLSAVGKDFETELVEKLMARDLAAIRSEIRDQHDRVTAGVERLRKIADTQTRGLELESKRQELEHRLAFYRKHGIEEKLDKQIGFDADQRKCRRIASLVTSLLHDLDNLVQQYEDDVNSHPAYVSKYNRAFFREYFVIYDSLQQSFGHIKTALRSGGVIAFELQAKAEEFNKLQAGLREEFARMSRELHAELKTADVGEEVTPDGYRQLHRELAEIVETLRILKEEADSRTQLQDRLLSDLAVLERLYRDEFRKIRNRLTEINETSTVFKIKSEFAQDKEAMVQYMQDIFRGSGLWGTTHRKVAEKFDSFAEMYRDTDKMRAVAGDSFELFSSFFAKNLKDLLAWQVPNLFTVEYRGRELKRHSLGQRASALMLFILNQRNSDVVLIDQPEDDLDNQTICEDVVGLVRQLKERNMGTQFVLATHNANFPVLGDAEQVVSCLFVDDMIRPTTGGIDRREIQRNVVDIMEGGDEAFRQRQRRYDIWTSKDS